MAWRRLGDKPLSEPLGVTLLTHICVTQSQYVNGCSDHWFLRLLNCHKVCCLWWVTCNRFLINHISAVIWRSSCKIDVIPVHMQNDVSSLWHEGIKLWCWDQNFPCKQGQNHDCWCPGSLCYQVISNHGAGYRGYCFPQGRIADTCVAKWQKMLMFLFFQK